MILPDGSLESKVKSMWYGKARAPSTIVVRIWYGSLYESGIQCFYMQVFGSVAWFGFAFGFGLRRQTDWFGLVSETYRNLGRGVAAQA